MRIAPTDFASLRLLPTFKSSWFHISELNPLAWTHHLQTFQHLEGSWFQRVKYFLLNCHMLFFSSLIDFLLMWALIASADRPSTFQESTHLSLRGVSPAPLRWVSLVVLVSLKTEPPGTHWHTWPIDVPALTQHRLQGPPDGLLLHANQNKTRNLKTVVDSSLQQSERGAVGRAQRPERPLTGTHRKNEDLCCWSNRAREGFFFFYHDQSKTALFCW